MNVYDSSRMADLLKPIGYQPTETADDADMVILNTCHIREKAAEKVYSDLGRLRLIKEERRKNGNDMIIAVAGCVAQAEGEEILARAPYVDMVFGPGAYHTLPEMVARAAREQGVALNTDFPEDDKFDHLPEARTVDGYQAFLTVQEGCDKFCTYCVVPYTRGAEYSRPVDRVMAEACQLVGAGAMELTLLGQNVNAYHGQSPDGKDWTLGRLIRHLADTDGLERIRYTTSYPAEVDDDLIAAHRDVEKLMPYLHLPVQSGSDRVLKAMNRKHTADDYRRLVDRLRAARPDLALSSDFIVGFPGETDAEFEETLNLVRDVGFVQAYSFKFSARPGTPAADMADAVADDIKAERLARLQEELTCQTQAFHARAVGRRMAVLFTGPGRHAGQLSGRSPWMQAVHVTAPGGLLGTVQTVEIEAAGPNSLAGRVISEGGDLKISA